MTETVTSGINVTLFLFTSRCHDIPDDDAEFQEGKWHRNSCAASGVEWGRQWTISQSAEHLAGDHDQRERQWTPSNRSILTVHTHILRLTHTYSTQRKVSQRERKERNEKLGSHTFWPLNFHDCWTVFFINWVYSWNKI